MTSTEFTPLASLAGGALIGLAVIMLMFSVGRIAGVSGILGRLVTRQSARSNNWWAWAFVAGVVLTPLLWTAVVGTQVEQTLTANMWLLGIAGLVTGCGVAIGNGCTSGHGVCGLSRLSTRSLAATITFMLSAAVTVYVVRHVVGGGA